MSKSTDDKIDDLAGMVKRGFDEAKSDLNGLKVDMNNRFKKVDERFEKIDERFEKTENILERMDRETTQQLDRIENILISQHEERISHLEDKLSVTK